MPSPLLKMKQRSSGGNVTVPNQSQTNKEGRGVVGIGGNVSSGDMQQAREDQDKMEKKYTPCYVVSHHIAQQRQLHWHKFTRRIWMKKLKRSMTGKKRGPHN